MEVGFVGRWGASKARLTVYRGPRGVYWNGLDLVLYSLVNQKVPSSIRPQHHVSFLPAPRQPCWVS